MKLRVSRKKEARSQQSPPLKEILTAGIASALLLLGGCSGGGSSSVDDTTDNTAGGTTGAVTTYAIGEVGPGGGVVFSVSADGTSGLEAAPADSVLGDATDLKFANAVQLVQDSTDAGFNDWSLPSQDELNLMFSELHKSGLGGFSAGNYWSSTASEDDTQAFYQNFGSGFQGSVTKADGAAKVRAVRSF